MTGYFLPASRMSTACSQVSSYEHSIIIELTILTRAVLFTFVDKKSKLADDGQVTARR